MIIENKTEALITIVGRRATEHRTATGSLEFDHVRIDLKPGMNELTDEQAEVVAEARAKNPITRRRFDKQQLAVLSDRPRNKAEALERIARCADADLLRRWRADARDKTILDAIEAQLDAVTKTTDGEPIASDVRRGN